LKYFFILLILNFNLIAIENKINLEKIIIKPDNNITKFNNNIDDILLTQITTIQNKEDNKSKVIDLNLLLENNYLINKIDFIYFRKKNDILYIEPYVKFDNNSTYRMNELEVNSFVRTYEKKLIDNDIQYTFNKEYEIEFQDILNIQHISFLTFVIYYLFEHLFSILFLILIFFLIIKSTSGLIGDKKYEIMFPKDIKGTMDDLIGMEEIKRDVLQLKNMIQKNEEYIHYGITNTFNILFSGPPGTGKTQISGFLAKELDIPIVLGTGNVETGFVGGGAGTLKTIFNKAEKLAKINKHKSCILFLDEAQVLLKKRGQGREKWNDDTANELLALLDGVKSKNRKVNIIVILASNFNESNFEIDSAMEERFKKQIFFRLPNKKEREKIFEYYINQIKSYKKEKNIDYDYLAKITMGISPRKIQTIINEASLYCIENKLLLNTKILSKSFEKITIGETTRKTTENSEYLREIIIRHELGHFFTQFENKKNELGTDNLLIIKDNMDFLKISSESISKYNALGFVLNSQNEDTILQTKQQLEDEIVSLYGGLASENHFFNNPTNGAHNDLEKITKILKLMVYEMGVYTDYKLNNSILDINLIDNDIIKLKSIELYKKSEKIIKLYENHINYLTNVLMEEWVLDKEDLFFYLENYKKIEKNNLILKLDKKK
jgi:cell division protease FtsH